MIYSSIYHIPILLFSRASEDNRELGSTQEDDGQYAQHEKIASHAR